jgi:DNA mismatch repair ATPase MutL
LRWNGKEKETVTLDVNKIIIFGLQRHYIQQIRENVLVGSIPLWIRIMKFQSKMYDFHRYTEEGNDENGVINRNNEMKTLSITQAVMKENKVSILHYDLIAQQDFRLHLSQFKIHFETIFHKITHWEYWPFRLYIFYLFLWSYYSIKAKSIFFNASNPTIKNGGYDGSKKSMI